ncbi:hypothetical protein BKA64DRAFT_208274 [Cadophora sp. MPI-SDFR-AT-0126]|nr:hypothetical protein BKA64DRAFT_208274 [Leotiomycetes sp. MPI-SDFR-AT-0126]
MFHNGGNLSCLQHQSPRLCGQLNPCKGLAYILESRIESIAQSGKGSILASFIPGITTSRTLTPLQRTYIRSSILFTNPIEYVHLNYVNLNSKTPLSKIKSPLFILAGKEDINVSGENILGEGLWTLDLWNKGMWLRKGSRGLWSKKRTSVASTFRNCGDCFCS